MSVDITHLLDDEAVPDTDPKPGEFTDVTKFLGGAGVKVSQTGGEVVIGLKPELFMAPKKVEDFGVSTTDPLRFMSFRAKLVDDGDNVEVQTSYLDSVYYDNTPEQWLHEGLEIAAETKEVLSLPKLLYLEVPMEWISGRDEDTPDPGFPFGVFSSDIQHIESADYVFNITYSTGYMRRRRGAGGAPVSWYRLYNEDEVPEGAEVITPVVGSTNLTGTWRFLIARLSEENGLEQIHLGPLTLPQAWTFNILHVEVV